MATPAVPPPLSAAAPEITRALISCAESACTVNAPAAWMLLFWTKAWTSVADAPRFFWRHSVRSEKFWVARSIRTSSQSAVVKFSSARLMPVDAVPLYL